MEKLKAFLKAHPTEAALMAGAAIIALYMLVGRSGGNSGQAASQSAYFAAEQMQAQTGAAIQVANINANRDVSLATIGAGVSQANATTWANTDLGITQSNNSTATAALPYAEESNLIGALAGVASQTQTTTKNSSGFFGIGGGSSQVTSSTPAAISASTYLDELANGHFAPNG